MTRKALDKECAALCSEIIADLCLTFRHLEKYVQGYSIAGRRARVASIKLEKDMKKFRELSLKQEKPS